MAMASPSGASSWMRFSAATARSTRSSSGSQPGGRRRGPSSWATLVVPLAAGVPSIGRRRPEVARPVAVDLGAGEPLPLAGVALAQVGVEHERTDAELAGDDAGRLGGPLQVRCDDGVHHTEGPGRVQGLMATEIREGRVGLPLPPAVGVPLGLAMADEQDPGHGVGTYPAVPPAGSRLMAVDRPTVATLAPCLPIVSRRSPSPEGEGVTGRVAVLRLFAGAREAAGVTHDEVPGATVGEVIDAARARYGEPLRQRPRALPGLAQRRALLSPTTPSSTPTRWPSCPPCPAGPADGRCRHRAAPPHQEACLAGGRGAAGAIRRRSGARGPSQARRPSLRSRL